MDTLTREPPAIGEIPEFDRFANQQLGDIGDCISEEQSEYAESLYSMGCDEFDHAFEMHLWWVEKMNSLREEFWLEWIGELITPHPSKDQVIKRLKRELRKAKRELDECQYHSEIELAGERAHVDAIMGTRCPTCDMLVSDFFN
jgi:hypothetical protein